MILNPDLEPCSACGELVDISNLYWMPIPSVVLCKTCWRENNGEE